MLLAARGRCRSRAGSGRVWLSDSRPRCAITRLSPCRSSPGRSSSRAWARMRSPGASDALPAGGRGRPGACSSATTSRFTERRTSRSREPRLFLRGVCRPECEFYAMALLVVWPGMLFAPALDRSRLRWLVRGDRDLPGAALVLLLSRSPRAGWKPRSSGCGSSGALPLWVVSYAGVIDDWVAAPVRRRLGDRERRWLVAFVCVGCSPQTGWRSRVISAARRAWPGAHAVVANVPGGSLVMYQGSLAKIVGTPLGCPNTVSASSNSRVSRPTTRPACTATSTANSTTDIGSGILPILHRTPGDPVRLTEYARAWSIATGWSESLSTRRC